MEIVFYVVMVMWGLYLVASEPIENVERDFGIWKQYGGSNFIREWYCSDVWISIVDLEYEVVMNMMFLIGAVLVVLVSVGFGSGFQTGSDRLTGSMRGSTRSISPKTRSHGKLQVQQLQVTPGREQTYRQPGRLPTVRPYAKIFQMYSRVLDEHESQDPTPFPTAYNAAS